MPYRISSLAEVLMQVSRKLAGSHYFLATTFLCLALSGFLPTSPPSLCGTAESCAGAEQQLSAAALQLERGNLDESERILTELQVSHSKCPEVVLGLGRVHAAQGNVLSAQRLLSLYTVLAPKDARGLYYLGQFLFSQGDYQRADTISGQALSLNPEYPDAMILRAQVLSIKGEKTEAQRLLERVCEVASSNAEAHFQLGSLFDRNKRHAEAVGQFEKVVALNPRDARAYDYLALNLEPLGQIEKAEAAYKKGLETNEKPFFDSFLDYNYGRFLLKRNRLVESQRHLDRALELTPQTRAAHYEHAKLNLRLKKYPEARLDAERALSLPDPTGFILDLQVYYLLSSIYTRLGEQELARKYVELSQNTPVPVQARERD
jgi:tetratricopeptide (TPR) repeat protein